MIELSKDFYHSITEAIEQKDAAFIQQSLADVPAADLSAMLYEMDTEECIYILQSIDKITGASIISNLEPYSRSAFLQNFKPEELAEWIILIDSDDAADILNDLPLRLREKTLAFIKDEEKAHYILDLLHYDERSAGGLMAKELIRANINWTVTQAIEEIRRQAEKVAKFYALYVVDDNNILKGRVSLKKIVLSSADTLISNIYEKEIVFVKTYYEDTEVAEIMQRYDLEAAPVINARGELVGRITIDDVVDVITEKAEQDIQLMSGLSEEVEEEDTVWILTRARLPWLIIGMMGGILGARFIGFFEKDLILLPAMAFFIPLITATGGNVGIQSSSIILQSLASKSLAKGNMFWRLLKVLLVAVINGVVISIIVFGFSLFLQADVKLSAIVAIALFCVVILASFMGTVTPLLLNRLHINPALAAGPFITTANDLLGLAVYFSVARVLYH